MRRAITFVLVVLAGCSSSTTTLRPSAAPAASEEPVTTGGASPAASVAGVPAGPAASRRPGRPTSVRPVPQRIAAPPRGGTIKLGFQSYENGAAAGDAIGLQGVSSGDTKKEIELIVKDLNARGGILGRKVVPVVVNYDFASPSGAEAQYQASCTTFTQDNPVFAITLTAQTSDTFRDCITKRGVPYIANSVHNVDDRVMSTTPGFVMVSSPSLTRIARTMPPALHAQKFFGPVAQARIGLLRADEPSWQRAANGALKPALKRIGYSVASEAVVSASDTGALSSQIPSAVLRFRTDGVTHVLVLERSGLASFLFMNAAERQGYRPKYGLTSQSLLQGFQAANSPGPQLANVTALGWLPRYDVLKSTDKTRLPAAERCMKIMKDGGLSFADQNAESIALWNCEAPWFLRAAAEKNPVSLTRSSVLSGATRLGTSFAATSTFRTRFGPGRRDGADAYRIVRYAASCGCFRYATAPRTFA